jgi:hypothetical protein
VCNQNHRSIEHIQVTISTFCTKKKKQERERNIRNTIRTLKPEYTGCRYNRMVGEIYEETCKMSA